LRATSVEDILLPGAVGRVLEVFAKGGYWGRFAAVIGGLVPLPGIIN
jgi:hypothetical protein